MYYRHFPLLFALWGVAASSALGATIGSLSDDFSAAAINGAKWTVIPSDFEAGSGTYTADTTTVPGKLTIAGVNNGVSFWGGAVLQSVDTFDSSKAATMVVDRDSISGAGSARRSSVWFKQTDGTYLHFAQNVGENGWQYNPNNTGGGTDIANLDALDGSTGLHQMQLTYLPQGGSSARIDMYLDGAPVATHTFGADWQNTTDFNLRLSGMAREAPGDTVSTQFDNFLARSVNAPATTQTNASSSTGFAVSNSDLIQGLTATVVGNVSPEETFTTSDVSALTNGSFGTPGLSVGNAGEVVAIHNNTSLTYVLDTSNNAGYEITGIASYTGWADNGRDNQDYVVLYSTIDDPDFFLPLDSIFYSPDANTPSGSEVFLTEASGGFLATNVAALRFSFFGTEAGYVGYREFDVFGSAIRIPEPASVLLWAVVGALLFGWARSRKAKK